MADESIPPKVFVSYSHDSQAHKAWVLTLAHRLVENGVDVVLDQWDLRLGSDLPRFMEAGLTESRRVIAVCTADYVAKANTGSGGVGYEKMILTAQLMRDVTTDRILPVIRDNTGSPLLPTFLGSRLFVDFRVANEYERKYAELLRDLHGVSVQPRPPLGPNPYRGDSGDDPPLSHRPERHVAPALQGKVTFDYSNNDGRFTIGSGDMAFTTRWSSASNNSIHAILEVKNMRSLALAKAAGQNKVVNLATL